MRPWGRRGAARSSPGSPARRTQKPKLFVGKMAATASRVTSLCCSCLVRASSSEGLWYHIRPPRHFLDGAHPTLYHLGRFSLLQPLARPGTEGCSSPCVSSLHPALHRPSPRSPLLVGALLEPQHPSGCQQNSSMPLQSWAQRVLPMASPLHPSWPSSLPITQARCCCSGLLAFSVGPCCRSCSSRPAVFSLLTPLPLLSPRCVFILPLSWLTMPLSVLRFSVWERLRTQQAMSPPPLLVALNKVGPKGGPKGGPKMGPKVGPTGAGRSAAPVCAWPAAASSCCTLCSQLAGHHGLSPGPAGAGSTSPVHPQPHGVPPQSRLRIRLLGSACPEHPLLFLRFLTQICDADCLHGSVWFCRFVFSAVIFTGDCTSESLPCRNSEFHLLFFTYLHV